MVVSLTPKAIHYFPRLAVGFLVNPVRVSGLGDYSCGAWQVPGGPSGYISPASAGPGQALKFTIAYLKSSDHAEMKCRQVDSIIIVWLYFGPVLGLLGGALTWVGAGWSLAAYPPGGTGF